MKRQVSVKVFLDEDLYQFYAGIKDGKKGQVVRDALRLYKDLNGYTGATSIIGILAEVRQGFHKLEGLLHDQKQAGLPKEETQINQQPSVEIEMDELLEGFIEGGEE